MLKNIVISGRPSEVASTLDLSAWRRILLQDPSLVPLHAIPGRNPRTGSRASLERPNSARWVDHPDNLPVFFILHNGQIEVPWADDHVLKKANEVAAVVNGRLTVEEHD